jgi:hypothetical protein
MADENELNDLRARIGRLSFGDQFRLLEWILAEHRQRCDEEEAAHRAATAEYLEQVKAFLERERQNASAG